MPISSPSSGAAPQGGIAPTENPLLTREALGDFFSRLVAWSLPVSYFLVSISFYLRTYDSAQIKITMTQVGCTFVMLAWALQLLFEGRWPFQKRDLPLVAPFIALLLSGIVSFAQSSFLAGSLEEFIRRVLYVFMALIVISEFRGRDRQKRLIRWLVAAFAVTVGYGFIQYFDSRLFPPGMGAEGLDPFIWRQAFSARVFSTFGNPNFYGNFLVIITPLLLALYFRTQAGLFRPMALIALLVPLVVLVDKYSLNSFGGTDVRNELWVLLGLAVVLVACVALIWGRTRSAAASGMLVFVAATFINIYATETKGAWMGFAAAVAGTAVLAGLFLVGREGRRVTLALLGVAVLVGILGGLVVRHYAMRRKQSVDFRVFTWIGTWDMIRRQPWLGTGIGSFKWAYPAYRRPEIILLEGRSNTETDHAEDEYLEVWFDEGVLGIGILLWLILSVSVLGLKTLRRLTVEGPRPPPERAFDDRVYVLLGYLGAWWGALIHWMVDVSIRFVSSGIFSFLLPALVVGLVRNEPLAAVQDRPSRQDRTVRLLTAALWAGFFLWAEVPPSGVLFTVSLLLVIGEVLEWRLTSETPPPSALVFFAAGALSVVAEVLEVQELTGPVAKPALHLLRTGAGLAFLGAGYLLRLHPGSATRQEAGDAASAGRPITTVQWLGTGALLVLWGWGAGVWRSHFLADVSHNVGIFFSRQHIWFRSPEFDARVNVPGYPADMKRRYEEVGGALEHYEQTARLNPNFPMALYFTGNVYNDWGSSVLQKATEARERGDQKVAGTLKDRAVEYWERSLATYDRVKAFAPNYVQTHHQVGLVYLKLGEMARAWGKGEPESYLDKALEHFSRYQQLDPVFPPNYYRQAYVHYLRGDYARAEEAYRGALRHNSANVVGRLYHDRNVETYTLLGKLFLSRLPGAGSKRTPDEELHMKKAEEYFKNAIESAALSGTEDAIGLEPRKALATLYARAGRDQEAQRLWQEMRRLNPEDPDVQRAFGMPSTPSVQGPRS